MRFLSFALLCHLSFSALALPQTDISGLSNDLKKYEERSLFLQRRADSQQSSENSFPDITSAASAAPYVKSPPRNKAMLWSGIEFNKAQAYSKEHHYQTLEQSVGPEILNHPDASDKAKWVPFWAALSEAFADKIVQTSDEATVELRAPNRKLTGPSDPLRDGRLYAKTDAYKIEIPILKKHNIKIYAMHPEVSGAAGKARYELWPNDQGYEWQAKYKLDGPRKEPGKKGKSESSHTEASKSKASKGKTTKSKAAKSKPSKSKVSKSKPKSSKSKSKSSKTKPS